MAKTTKAPAAKKRANETIPVRLISVSPGPAVERQTAKDTESLSDALILKSDKRETPPAKPATATFNQTNRAKRKSSNGWKAGLQFTIFVLLPTLAVALFYFFWASPQYVVETQFAVRGSDSSPLGSLGLSALPGTSAQDADSYIVQNYIKSKQIAKDILVEQNIDIRKFYSRPWIDFVSRAAPDIPYIDFEELWQDQIEVEFNSISGNTTFRVYAFTPEDTYNIAKAVVKQSEKIVNELSKESRENLIGTAKGEVERIEHRLSTVQQELQTFQNQSQVIDPTSVAKAEIELVGRLESELASLSTRRRTLRGGVSKGSVSLRVIDRQIESVKEQISQQREKIGSGKKNTVSGNLAETSTKFIELTLALEFAKNAYVTAQTSLEAARTDARKQQRYLATYIPPEMPTVSRHPRPVLYTGIAFLWFIFAWLVGLFLLRTIKDHLI